MIDGLIQSLSIYASNPALVVVLICAVLVGIVFGIVPGLNGKTAIVFFLPALIGIDQITGLVFLIAMHAVIHTAGAVPSILFGVPGTAAEAATVIDGFQLTKQGQAARALGASFSASGIGGVIGGIFLLCMLPVIKPIILLITPSEHFLLMILGISSITAVSGNSLRRGIAVGCMGLCLSFVGLSPHTGEPRYTLGFLTLWDGLDMITLVLAVFAVPELISMAVDQRQTLPSPVNYKTSAVYSGLAEVLNHKWLTIRTSIIGAFIGLVPGLGGDVASWMCYGHAVQSSAQPEKFGKGAIEGVIAPETANNSKEGGALIPTLFFGIPGSTGMAVLLAAFIMLGIQPGPNLLDQQSQLLNILIVTLVLANVLAVVILLGAARFLAKIAFIPTELIVALGLVMIVTGSYLGNLNWVYLLLLYLFSIVGYVFKRFEWPRAPFVIGLVLGGRAEISLNQAITIWGYDFFLKPLSLILIVAIIASLGMFYWQRKLQRSSITERRET